MGINKYTKKPIPVEAKQWFKDGDHKRVSFLGGSRTGTHCDSCNKAFNLHGWIETLEGGHIVCPSDWIIKDSAGYYFVLENSIFKETYEKAK